MKAHLNRFKAQIFKFSTNSSLQNKVWPALILGAGILLRFYQLGSDSLWLDEAGVAYAARAASLREMLQVVRSHVLAMPLDYWIVWLVGKISQTELALRIPAAVWGCLTLFLAFRFFQRFTDRTAALLGLLVLALSPLHIQYSQELRFYASLVFFYLLASLTLWDALQQPARKRWIYFVAAGITGVFFHPYVLFALVNGLVWLLLSGSDGWKDPVRRVNFIFAACLILLAFLGGYLVFSASNYFKIPLLAFEETFLSAIAAGLGWLPFYAASPDLSWVWGGLCAFLQILGVWKALKTGPRSPLAGLFYSLVLQAAAVLAFDILGHYFFAPRQFLFLLPVLCLLAGSGLASAINWIRNRLRSFPQKRKPGLAGNSATILVMLLVILSSLPALRMYYQDDKGNSRAITQTILRTWQPGDTVLVIPGYEGFVYKYYLEDVYQQPDVSSRLWTANWEDIRQVEDWTGRVYVITPARISPEETHLMIGVGFSPLFESNPQSRYARVLWMRQAGD